MGGRWSSAPLSGEPNPKRRRSKPLLISGRQPATTEDARSLEEREMEYYGHFIEELRRLSEYGVDEKLMNGLLQPADNSAFADAYLNFTPLSLPKDEEGYAVSFDAEDARSICEFFDSFGFVVVRSVVDAEACRKSREEFWDLMEHMCPGLERHSPETWDSWCQLKALGFAGMDCSLSPQHFKNRVNKQVHAAFSAVFGRPDLHVNVGRLGAMRPTLAGPIGGAPEDAHGQLPVLHADRPKWRTVHGVKWLHWDANPWTGAASSFSWLLEDPMQNRAYTHRQVATQAILALADCAEANGGFLCVPGSHKAFRGWAHAHSDGPKGYALNSPAGSMQLQLPPGDTMMGWTTKVPIREGDLLIWNAELAHANYPNKSSSMRLVQYIQMKPADDEVFTPLFNNAEWLPPASELPLDSLGRKLLALEAW